MFAVTISSQYVLKTHTHLMRVNSHRESVCLSGSVEAFGSGGKSVHRLYKEQLNILE